MTMPDTRQIPLHAKIQRLADRPKYLRASAKGLSAIAPELVRIDREGGDYHAGLIRGVSLCTRGEALGHGMWLDQPFIESVSSCASQSGNGVKARFTHPGLSSDGLGTFLGRIKGCRTEGGKSVGDLHFSQAAHRTPDGDLATYVMDLAEGDPEAFAMSIVFEPDYEAEGEFILENGGRITPSGYIDDSEFVSPDPDNTKNLPHARLAALRGCDVVDEPAANPDGLFHREQQFAQEADGILSYALGMAPEPPACVAFGERLAVHPDRIKSFVSRFLDAHGLQVTTKSKENTMSEPTIPPADSQPEEAKPQADDQTTQDGDQGEATGSPEEAKPQDGAAPEAAEQGQQGGQEQPEEQPTSQEDGDEQPQPQQAGEADADEQEPQLSEGPAECKRYVEAFGAQGGVWYAEGLSFEQAQQRQSEALKAENVELRRRLAAAGADLGEADPLEFQPQPEKSKPGSSSTHPLAAKLGEPTARIAAGIKIRRKGETE